MPFVFVALGGALGSVLRYALALALPSPPSSSSAATFMSAMPWGTFLANVVGSFLLGLIASALGERRFVVGSQPVAWRTFLGSGVMGGFTTYSTFNLEALRYFERGDARWGSVYIAMTMATCLVAGGIGLALGRKLSA